MKRFFSTLYCILLLFPMYGQGLITLKKANALTQDYPDKVSYLLTSVDAGYDSVRQLDFQALSSYPEIYDRYLGKAIWMKFSCVSPEDAIYVFDFFRKDYVDLYVEVNDSTVRKLKTGFVLKSSEKDMGKWNTIQVEMEKDQSATFYVRAFNVVNESDLVLNINEVKVWRDEMLYSLIGDVAFLAMLLIILAYSLLVFLQSRVKAYLHLAMYLFFVFVFYAFITKIMRDYMMPEVPWLTHYSVATVLIIPYFYYGFVREFLNLYESIPKLNKIFQWIVRIDLVIFVLITIQYANRGDYFVFSDIVRYTMFANVIFCFVVVFAILRKWSPLVAYFAMGTVAMLVCVSIDLIIWRSYTTKLGDVARIGIILEILFFSIGLGKKTQIVEEEARSVQKSYIEQLEINKGLIEDQKTALGQMVEDRTRELIIAKEKAEKHAKAREEFLSVMSHEIKTPMNAIVGLTHLLTESSTPEERTKNMDTLRYSVDNLLSLINDILDYRKIDSGNIVLEHIPFSLSRMVSGVIHLFEPEANNKDIQLKMDYDPSVSDHFYGDPHRLSQVIGNLLSNAIKFTEEGSVMLSISLIENHPNQQDIKFEVKDTGIGISVEAQKRVFQHFNQENLATTRKYGGTGLGLAICKSLVNLMGGVIMLKSTVGQGSSFSFKLKLEKSNEPPNDIIPTEVVNSVEQEIKGLRCLIVDDNKLNRIVLRKFLKKWAVLSDDVSSGMEGMDYLSKNKYDILLLDLQMPEMDGYEVTRRLRMSGGFNQDIPIVAITADSISNVEEKVLAVGMNDFVTKPFDPQYLKSIIYKYAIANKAMS